MDPHDKPNAHPRFKLLELLQVIHEHFDHYKLPKLTCDNNTV